MIKSIFNKFLKSKKIEGKKEEKQDKSKEISTNDVEIEVEYEENLDKNENVFTFCSIQKEKKVNKPIKIKHNLRLNKEKIVNKSINKNEKLNSNQVYDERNGNISFDNLSFNGKTKFEIKTEDNEDNDLIRRIFQCQSTKNKLLSINYNYDYDYVNKTDNLRNNDKKNPSFSMKINNDIKSVSPQKKTNYLKQTNQLEKFEYIDSQVMTTNMTLSLIKSNIVNEHPSSDEIVNIIGNIMKLIDKKTRRYKSKNEQKMRNLVLTQIFEERKEEKNENRLIRKAEIKKKIEYLIEVDRVILVKEDMFSGFNKAINQLRSRIYNDLLINRNNIGKTENSKLYRIYYICSTYNTYINNISSFLFDTFIRQNQNLHFRKTIIKEEINKIKEMFTIKNQSLTELNVYVRSLEIWKNLQLKVALTNLNTEMRRQSGVRISIGISKIQRIYYDLFNLITFDEIKINYYRMILSRLGFGIGSRNSNEYSNKLGIYDSEEILEKMYG